MFYAHSGRGADRSDWQPLAVHLSGVAEIAAAHGQWLGLAGPARIAGLLHDLGKFSLPFQGVLAGSGERVDHSTAGAYWVRALAREASVRDAGAIADLVAYAVAGHHAGLPDRDGADRGTLEARLAAFEDQLDPSWRTGIGIPDDAWRLPDLQWIRPSAEDRQRQRVAFQWSMVGRMIFSLLIDADRGDTEAYSHALGGIEIDRTWPEMPELVDGLIARFDAHMARLSTDSPIGRVRSDILAHVRGRATLPPGFFTLTVPTGGGKTLASLGFALDHARRHKRRRIVYAIPFTSVTEQTAAIFREVLGDDVVLEQHSALDDDGTRGDPRDVDNAGQRGRLRRAMEDWAPPVIVTTSVQLFESLFAARPSRARKLYNLAGSVIVLDEAQTIPLNLLGPAVWALEALVRDWGCSVVLCTATQPALARALIENPKLASLIGLDLDPERELASDPPALFGALRRTTLKWAGKMDDAALVAALRDTPQALVIVNSRRHALALYRAVVAAGLDGPVHLSTRQHAFDRQAILADIRARLHSGAPCRLIATSLVEAGVDLDFPCGWRAETGLSSIAQAAGRVNREGIRTPADSILTVFEAPDDPPPPEIRGFIGDTRRMMGKHADLFSPEAMRDYFAETYWRKGPESLDQGPDGQSVLGCFGMQATGTQFAYRRAAERFRMIQSGMLPVIVPTTPEAHDAVRQLDIEAVPTGRLARALQRYTVNVPPKARELLVDRKRVRFFAPELRGDAFAVLVDSSLYGSEVGLLWEDPDYMSLDNLFF